MTASYLSRTARASLFLAALSFAGAASAATLEYDFSVASTKTTFSSVQSLTRFNPALGVLSSVTFGLRDSLTSTISLENFSSSPGNTTIVGTANGAFTLVNDASPSTNYVTGGNLSVSQGTGDSFAPNPTNALDYASPYGIKYAPKTVSDSLFTTNNLSSPQTLLDFSGLTPINLRYTATGTSNYLAANGNGLAAFVTFASADGYVIYNYTPAAVPEPASVAALGLGVLGLIRRRKVSGK